MKKYSLVLCILLFSTFLPLQFVHANNDSLAITVNGQYSGSTYPPIIQDGIKFFPIAAILNLVDISGTESIY